MEVVVMAITEAANVVEVMGAALVTLAVRAVDHMAAEKLVMAQALSVTQLILLVAPHNSQRVSRINILSIRLGYTPLQLLAFPRQV